eukprot:scaffold83337_cov64-Phaeocystis_antarctica.AAC.4
MQRSGYRRAPPRRVRVSISPKKILKQGFFARRGPRSERQGKVIGEDTLHYGTSYPGTATCSMGTRRLASHGLNLIAGRGRKRGGGGRCGRVTGGVGCGCARRSAAAC